MKAIVIPIEGYLKPFPDSDDELPGSVQTFDGMSFVSDVTTAKQGGKNTFASADGSKTIEYNSKVHDIALVEGHYVLLREKPWRKLNKKCFDAAYWVETDEKVAMDRVEARLVDEGMSVEEAKE